MISSKEEEKEWSKEISTVWVQELADRRQY